jgi:hypothetical protein
LRTNCKFSTIDEKVLTNGSGGDTLKVYAPDLSNPVIISRPPAYNYLSVFYAKVIIGVLQWAQQRGHFITRDIKNHDD